MTPDERWEAGIEHHAESVALIRGMQLVDSAGDAYDALELGGDGDNGETLAYLLDELIDKGYISILILNRELQETLHGMEDIDDSPWPPR